jgi:hypothetical protein
MPLMVAEEARQLSLVGGIVQSRDGGLVGFDRIEIERNERVQVLGEVSRVGSQFCHWTSPFASN